MTGFHKGSVIKIGKDKYDIIGIWEELDGVKDNKLVGEHTQMDLHEHGSGSLHKTHIIKIYYENEGECFLFSAKHKPNGAFELTNKKEVKINTIELI